LVDSTTHTIDLRPGFVAVPLKGAVPGLTGLWVMRRMERE